MSALKKLLGQTAVYGLSSIVGRLLNYLLVPLYTYSLPTGEYGMVSELYSYVALMLALLIYGMETTFFRYSETEKDSKKVLSTSSISILISTLIFLVLAWTFKGDIASAMNYQDYQHFISWFIIILGLEVLSSIPFAYLRQQNKAVTFVSLKMINIFINLGLNLFFILYCPVVINAGPTHLLYPIVSSFFQPDSLVQYIFISNLIASTITFILLLPIYRFVRLGFSMVLWKKMIPYALPILIVNLAGLIPISIDKILLDDLYSGGQEEGLKQLGIYSANAKIAVIMMLFIQTFRYAADPFFFAEARNKNAKETYAQVMHYFVIIGSFIFLGVLLFMDVIQHFIGKDYREGFYVIPILLMANLMLGIYYNLSFWYKLTNKTIYGAWFSIVGAVIAILLNFILVPHYGMLGSAWSVFAAYFVSMMLSYLYGRKYYPIPYKILPIIAYPLIASLLYLSLRGLDLHLFLRIGIFLLCLGVVFLIERKRLMKLV